MLTAGIQSPPSRKTASDPQIFGFKSSTNGATSSLHQNLLWFPFFQGTPHLEAIYLAIKVSSHGSSATSFQSPSPPPSFSLLSVGETVDSTIYGCVFFCLFRFCRIGPLSKNSYAGDNSEKRNTAYENNMKRVAHTDEAAIVNKNYLAVKCSF